VRGAALSRTGFRRLCRSGRLWRRIGLACPLFIGLALRDARTNFSIGRNLAAIGECNLRFFF
jgi:hypothetical protein